MRPSGVEIRRPGRRPEPRQHRERDVLDVVVQRAGVGGIQEAVERAAAHIPSRHEGEVPGPGSGGTHLRGSIGGHIVRGSLCRIEDPRLGVSDQREDKRGWRRELHVNITPVLNSPHAVPSRSTHSDAWTLRPASRAASRLAGHAQAR